MEKWLKRSKCRLYCKYKKPCPYKKIQKSRYHHGLYYVVCTFPEQCNQQTIYPKKIDLRKRVKHAKKKV